MSDVTTQLAMEASDKAAEIARLKADNAKLREEFNKMDVWHSKELTAAMAENAKLRELIRELFRDFANADYELKSRCGRTFMAVTRYLPRLQELEVEP